jgi:hypothetical protein
LPLLPQTAAQRLHADLTFLTSDRLAGRLSMTPQADIAALYIAAEFQKTGLQPGNGDSYLQQFPLVAYRGDPKARRLAFTHNGRTKQFQSGSDFTGAYYRETHIDAPLVFAGYGITAPEYGYDDYAGLNVNGKVVLLFDHEPQEDDPRSVFAGTGQTLHWGRYTKMRNAQRHGAVAVLIASEPLRKHAGLLGATGRSSSAAGQPLRASAPPQALEDPTQIPVFSVSDAVLADLLAATQRPPGDVQRAIDAKLEPQSRPLGNTTIRLDTANAEERHGTSMNVIGVLEGGDPALRSETVMLTAHYDHLGVQNGRVYPGANDNASGTAAVLELARRMTQAGVRPKRTLVFAIFGSEEELMLGSFYYVQHPLRPLDRTRAVLNLDMIGRDEAPIPQSEGVIEIPSDTSNSMNLVGGYYSPDLIDALRGANRTAGLIIDTKFNNDHGLNTLFRCDHLPFLLAGVPAVWIFGGFHPGYHEPLDTMEQLSYVKIAKAIELALRAAWEVSDAATPPRFFAGNETTRRR